MRYRTLFCVLMTCVALCHKDENRRLLRAGKKKPSDIILPRRGGYPVAPPPELDLEDEFQPGASHALGGPSKDLPSQEVRFGAGPT